MRGSLPLPQSEPPPPPCPARLPRNIRTYYPQQLRESRPICTRYLVMPGLIGGSPRGVGDPDQQSHLHHGTVVLEMPGVPASPADRPRPYRCPSGRRRGKGLSEREGRWCCGVLCSPHSPGVSFPLTVTTPLGGSRGRHNPRPRSLLEKVHKRLRVIVRTHLHQRDVGDRWGCDGVILPAKQAPDGPPVFILRLDHEPEAILLLQLHVHQRLLLSLVKTSDRLH